MKWQKHSNGTKEQYDTSKMQITNFDVIDKIDELVNSDRYFMSNAHQNLSE